LSFERYQLARRVGAGRAAGVNQQQQRQQAAHLAFGGQQGADITSGTRYTERAITSRHDQLVRILRLDHRPASTRSAYSFAAVSTRASRRADHLVGCRLPSRQISGPERDLTRQASQWPSSG
jgi:hypothetical protein